jgi:hypothetical protein
MRDAAGAASVAALDVLAKAQGDEDDDGAQPSENTPATAAMHPSEIGDPTAEPKALFWDPFSVIDALGYKERPSSISYSTLQAMVFRMPILQAIIKTRTDQLASFSMPQEDKFQTGFRIQLRDRKAAPSRASEKMSKEITNWMMTTGKVADEATPNARDNFETFLRKITRDALTYDQMGFEVREDRGHKPFDFYAVDGATLRIADTTKLHYQGNPDETRYVQIYDGLVTAEYGADQLCFGIRNPVTDIRNQGYGVAETEMLITTVTSLLWSWDYNQKFFSQGTSSKGIINFKGAVPERQLRAFRRHWYSMVAGIENAFKTPITNAEGLEYIKLQESNKDMEFSAWFDFLIKVACAIYGMDPLEINFKYGDSGGASSMFESNNKQKLANSKDKGLQPLLRFIAHRLSSYLVHRIDEDFEFAFVGLDAASPEELADLNTKLVSSYKTVDEVRAEEDLPPLPDGEGEVILNPVWMQNKTMAAQQDMEVGDFAPPPEPGEEDDGFGGELDGIQNENAADDEGASNNVEGGPPGKPAKPDAAAKSMGWMDGWLQSADGLWTHSPTEAMRADAALRKGQPIHDLKVERDQARALAVQYKAHAARESALADQYDGQRAHLATKLKKAERRAAVLHIDLDL